MKLLSKITTRTLKHFTVLLSVLFVTIYLHRLHGQQYLSIDNPLKGRIVFEQKGCITCHSIKGEGGNVGPDLGQKNYYGSFLKLASIMWNHSPEMLKRMRELYLPYPEFSKTEMVELIAYLYYLRYLGEPGDLYKGKILVEEKGCLMCHSVGGRGGKTAPAFDKLAKYVSPLYMAQALWNHGPSMNKELEKSGHKRPTFQKGEIVDLSAYIRKASRGTERDKVFMSPGNPQRGESIFKTKGCNNCHSLNGKGKYAGPNLKDREWNYSVTEIAGIMWNHASPMGEHMIEMKMSWPKLSGREMSDLIAFLYFLGFEDKPGNIQSGKKVFIEKGCSSCHGENGRGGKVGPDLSKSNASSSPIALARIMWNHAPVMEEKVIEKAIHWPTLSGEEIRDLYGYLHSLITH